MQSAVFTTLGLFSVSQELSGMVMAHLHEADPEVVAEESLCLAATATARAIEAGRDWFDVGGPEVFTHEALARLAFDALDRPARITRLPDALRRLALRLLPLLTPARIHGPALFFLSAMGEDMVGACRGTRRLADHFRSMT